MNTSNVGGNNFGNLSNFDSKSQNNNFSTTTKSKFNTIDQYNNNI